MPDEAGSKKKKGARRKEHHTLEERSSANGACVGKTRALGELPQQIDMKGSARSGQCLGGALPFCV